MLCILCIVLISVNINEAKITPLPNGILVTGQTPVDVIQQHWTIVITLEPPEMPSNFSRSVNLVRQALIRSAKIGKIETSDVNSWSVRLNRLGSCLQRRGRLINVRHRRGLFDFGGSILHSVFGVATDDSIEKLRKLIQQTKKNQDGFQHKVNEMVTTLNHAYDDIRVNRDKLVETVKRVNDMSVFVNRLTGMVDENRRRWNRLELIVRFDLVISELETIVQQYLIARRKYDRQRYSIELGKLTEELFPIQRFMEIKNEVGEDNKLIEPLQWYYSYVKVRPIWIDNVLRYTAAIPLISTTPYIEYGLNSWPMPLNNLGTTMTVLISATHIGLNTKSGMYFVPKDCRGVNPRVCYGGALLHSKHIPCISGILNKKVRRECKIKLQRSNDTSSKILEITPGEFVLSSHGELIKINCPGKQSSVSKIKTGVYLLDPRECVYRGRAWSVSAIKNTVSESSIVAARIALNMVNIPRVLNETLIERHLNATSISNLERVKYVKLSTLPDIKDDYDYECKVSTDKLKNVLVIAIITIVSILVLIELVILGRKLYLRYKNKVNNATPPSKAIDNTFELVFAKEIDSQDDNV